MLRNMLLATALLALLPLAATAQSDGDVTAILDVDLVGAQYKECAVTVPGGSNVGDLLDAAVAQGCIDSWTYDEFPGFGRFVTSIDGIPAAVVTYWAFYVDGAYAQNGIDTTTVEDGHTYTFNYEQWVVPTA